MEIRAEDIHYSYDTRGYMLYYKGKPIGGAGISKEAKGCRANLKLFRNGAEFDKNSILRCSEGGRGSNNRYIVEIERIENELRKTPVYFVNRETGEVLTREEMTKQFREEYDGDDPTNAIDISEYYEEVRNDA